MTVFLHMFHGRDTTTEDMEDWGYDGPTLGPFDYIHITYGYDVKYSMEAEAYKAAFPEDEKPYIYDGKVEGHFKMTEGLLCYQGKYYGDFSIFTEDLKPGYVKNTPKQKVFTCDGYDFWLDSEGLWGVAHRGDTEPTHCGYKTPAAIAKLKGVNLDNIDVWGSAA